MLVDSRMSLLLLELSVSYRNFLMRQRRRLTFLRGTGEVLHTTKSLFKT